MTDAGYNAQQCSPATRGGPTGLAEMADDGMGVLIRLQ
ncbi:hypothetical protein ABIE52_000513 [Rhodococcus sp. OAS809]